MTADVQSTNKLDAVKWLVVATLVIVAIVGNQMYAEQSGWLRFAAVTAMLAAACFVAYTTGKGRAAFEFAKEAHLEVRKVVWPTRQETVQTTLIVGAFVIIMSLILWGVDSLIVWLLSFIVG